MSETCDPLLEPPEAVPAPGPRPGPAAGSPASAGAGGEVIVRLDSIHRSFGSVVALDGVSLDVRRGEIFGIIGRSGAGKSTLIRTLNGLERIDGGRIVVDGSELGSLDETGLNRIRRKIGMIFQHFNLLSMKTVFENVELPLKLAGLPGHLRADAVWQLLDLVGLRDKAAVHPARLSGGQKQRVGIARALAGKPDLLLSDEATSALDPETTLSILELLRELKGRLGVTIILITHEMSVIRQICDRVAVLDHGRIVEHGPVWEVFGQPRTELTRRLLGLRPTIAAGLTTDVSIEPVAGGRCLVRVSAAGGQPATGVQPAGFLALLAADSGWQTDIVHADVDRIAGHPVGGVTLSLRYREEPLRRLLAAAKRQSIDVEVLGYVGG